MARRDYTQSNIRLPMRVWDLPIRLFHWAIVCLIIIGYISDRENWMRIHVLSGFTVLGLLIFRLFWGIFGSETARFRAFLRSPLAGLVHLAHIRRREPDDQIGHNEAGGWMVLAMLLVLAVQAATGLFANDDGATEGPLAKYVGKAMSDRISGWHALNFYVLLALIVLHLGAITAYAVLKRHDLVRPMITGKKKLPAATRAPRMASSLLALAVALAAGAAVWALATRA